jgi:hypothetical protein
VARQSNALRAGGKRRSGRGAYPWNRCDGISSACHHGHKILALPLSYPTATVRCCCQSPRSGGSQSDRSGKVVGVLVLKLHVLQADMLSQEALVLHDNNADRLEGGFHLLVDHTGL